MPDIARISRALLPRLTRRPRPRRRIRRSFLTVGFARRALALLLLAAAAVFAAQPATSAQAPRAPAAVTGRDASAGHNLAAADLRVPPLPARAIRAGALAP